jgi:hypothetical protein
MKTILACLLVLIISTTAHAIDSEIVIFDEAQSAFSRFDDNEIKAWKQIDLSIAAFHEEWKKLNQLSRKRNRLIFLYKLQNEPNKIHWDSWKGWLRPIESATDAETFKKTIPEFREITAAFDKQKQMITAQSDLLVKRNTIYGKNKDIFTKLENTLSDELLALEKRMDKVRKSQAPQNITPKPQRQ